VITVLKWFDRSARIISISQEKAKWHRINNFCHFGTSLDVWAPVVVVIGKRQTTNAVGEDERRQKEKHRRQGKREGLGSKFMKSQGMTPP
jgi:hypothetical protein